MKQLYTPWGETLDRACPLAEYPRPQLVRGSYLCLNGLWDYAVEDGDDHTRRNTGKILVPFAPESLLSGCGAAPAELPEPECMSISTAPS